MRFFPLLIALLLTGPSVLHSQTTTPPGNPLVGLWGTEQSFGSPVRGTLTIDARQAQWRAAIAGFEVSVDRLADRLNFSLPNGVGEFHGRLDPASNTIIGQWIQPVGVVNNNRYATPVRLVVVNKSVWTGVVVPLDDHVSFYVSIKSGPGDSIAAIIINPEFNLFRRRSYDVILNGSEVAFANPKRPEDHFHGTYDKASDHLFLSVLDSCPAFPLSRRDRGAASGFYARTPDTAKYT